MTEPSAMTDDHLTEADKALCEALDDPFEWQGVHLIDGKTILVDAGEPYEASRRIRELSRKLAASEADADRLAEALAGNGSWLERWAAHVGNCGGDKNCTCGLVFNRHDNNQALTAHNARKDGE